MLTNELKTKKAIPPKMEDVIKDRKARQAITNLVGQLGEMRETRKQLEDEEREAKRSLIEYRDTYNFTSMHVGTLKVTVDKQTRDSLNRDLLIEHLEQKGWTAKQIKACLDDSTKTSEYDVVRVVDIPKSELRAEYD